MDINIQRRRRADEIDSGRHRRVIRGTKGEKEKKEVIE